MNEIESLAASFHRALAFGHIVAAWFNYRRRNWRWVAFHAVVAGFDLHAARCMTPEQSFENFAAVINGKVPFGYSANLRVSDTTARGFCGDCEKRVALSPQGLCYLCGGFAHDADEVERMREVALRFDLKSQPSQAVKAAAAKFMESVQGNAESAGDHRSGETIHVSA